MRWFAAFFVTVLLALVFMGLLALRAAGIPYLSDALIWAIPFGWLPGRAQLLLLFGTYVVVRAAMQRILAYTESAVDSSPRGRSGFRATLGAASYRFLANPTGRWISPYAILLGLAVLASWPLMGLGMVPALAWGVTALYALTLTSAMLRPDRPQPLRPGPEPEVDPILDLPGEPAATTT